MIGDTPPEVGGQAPPDEEWMQQMESSQQVEQSVSSSVHAYVAWSLVVKEVANSAQKGQVLSYA